MHLTVEPPLSQWSLGIDRDDARDGLVAQARANAARLGSAPLVDARRLVMTGHQADLWHPGILAKDLAMVAAASRLGAGACHLIVDQDVHATMRLDLPVNTDGRLGGVAIQLGSVDASIPTGSQPPLDAEGAVRQLAEVRREHGEALAVDVGPITAALTGLPPCTSLAEQIAVVTERLLRPWTGPMPLLFASELLTLPSAARLVEQMRADAQRCAQCYNEAAARYPGAGIARVAIASQRVELPLWHLRFGHRRLRVYAGLAAGAEPTLVDETGLPISDVTALAPRALLLTALLRSVCCDLFIHGKGGWVYDRVTELWWRQWRGEELAPMALASADLHLPFDAPSSDADELARAVWWAHHLPHNIDRHVDDLTPAERILADDKKRTIAQMRDDGDRARRARDFAELHRINDTLVGGHAVAVDRARQRLCAARRGVANRAIAQRRDWSFGLYPAKMLAELADRLDASQG